MASEAAEGRLGSFSALSDRLLPAKTQLAAWCPTMDLLAVAFADGRVAVHRLNWQRLWMVTPDAAPTALAWTPSGSALAVGRQDGTVSLLASETGDVEQELKAGADEGADASLLLWQKCTDRGLLQHPIPELQESCRPSHKMCAFL